MKRNLTEVPAPRVKGVWEDEQYGSCAVDYGFEDFHGLEVEAWAFAGSETQKVDVAVYQPEAVVTRSLGPDRVVLEFASDEEGGTLEVTLFLTPERAHEARAALDEVLQKLEQPAETDWAGVYEEREG